MSISDEQLTHLETLARLTLDDGERESVREDLGDILAHFDSLRELDTEGVEELVRPVPLSNVLREDATRESLPPDTALALGVETEEGFFKVPRTVEEDG